MAMAEGRVKSVDASCGALSSGSVGVMEEEDDTTTAGSASILLPANKVSRAPLVLIWSCTRINCLYQRLKCMMDAVGCLRSPYPAPSSSEYQSTHIQAIMESNSELKTRLESEIEASKAHWSEVQAVGNGGEGSSAEKNREVFRSLQHQYKGPGGFFGDWDDDCWTVGEKIAEGAQGEIFKLRLLRPEYAVWNERVLLKVFKLKGCSLEDLQKQWPPGMLLKAAASEDDTYLNAAGSRILGGGMLSDGRFAFVMLRYWGDLRKVIDLIIEHNGNLAPPFPHDTALKLMLHIAVGMKRLHEDSIVHRDLKASNVLICPKAWDIGDNEIAFQEGFNPSSDFGFVPVIADFECSHGVWGTRFWRAPEMLLGVRNQDVQLSFTEKSDVYSYAMTCYEVLTGKIPLDDMRVSDYGAVLLRGARPMLPSGMEPWVESLLRRCWDQEPSQRPSFVEIVEEFNGKGYFEDDSYDEQLNTGAF